MRVRATAPVRVADLGGWTDTWFAGTGRVCSIAVEPGAVVELELHRRRGPVHLFVGATGEEYDLVAGERPGRHPILEAALRALPPPAACTVRVGARVPPGSGVGTSASVVVALLGALSAVRDGEPRGDALAEAAHAVETGLGLQSGVQDQFAAVYGGISDLLVRYPQARRREVEVPAAALDRLERCLVTVHLGRPHTSWHVHDEVIARLGASDAGPWLDPLRQVAAEGAAALRAGDLVAHGRAMQGANEAIRALHPSLVSPDADALGALARRRGALGWKVNGAGGDGGSITALLPDGPAARAFEQDVAVAGRRWRVLPLRLAHEGVVIA